MNKQQPFFTINHKKFLDRVTQQQQFYYRCVPILDWQVEGQFVHAFTMW